LNASALHCTALHCTALHCTAPTACPLNFPFGQISHAIVDAAKKPTLQVVHVAWRWKERWDEMIDRWRHSGNDERIEGNYQNQL
jgi:hypothetical protein